MPYRGSGLIVLRLLSVRKVVWIHLLGKTKNGPLIIFVTEALRLASNDMYCI